MERINLQLQCNHLVNPLAVECGEVLFSFCKNGRVFDEYTLGIASSEDNLNKGVYDVYNGVNEGSRVRLNLNGTAGQRLFWRIATKDFVSETAYFEWAEDFTKAKWISAAAETEKILRFQKSFALQEGVLSARLHICGLGFYDFQCNGKRVDERFFKPDFSDYIQRKDEAFIPKLREEYYAYYQSYDVLPYLQQGANIATIEVAPGYFNNTDIKEFSFWHFGKTRLKFLFVFRYADRTEYVVSDESCLCAVTNSASTLYVGDKIDFTEKAYAYAPASVIDEEIPLRPARSYGDRVGEVFYPKLIKEAGNKRLYDFGQNHTGGLSCALIGEEGTEVVVRYAEILDENGEPNFKTASFDGETPQTSKYRLSGGRDEVKPKFCWYCYRYAEVEAARPIQIQDVQSLFIHAAVEQDGEFICSEPIFNDIYQKYLYTQLCNMHAGVPTDCPHREKKPYTGDGHLTVRSALYSFTAEGFYAKWLQDILDAQEQDGYIPHTAPRMGCGGGFYWGYAVVEVAKTLYQTTGDRSYVVKSYDAVKNWVECFSRMHEGDYLPKNNGRAWCLSDWLSPEEVRVDTRYFNAVVFYLSVRQLNAFHEILYGEKSSKWTDLAENIKRAIRIEYFDKQAYRYAKGAQGETALALWAGLCEDEDICGLQNSLRRHYTEATNGHFDTGIALTPILLEYLTDNGMKDLALRLMTQKTYPSFAYLLNGETTIVEHWSKKWIAYKFSEDRDEVIEGGGDLSHCHPMFGSVVSWLFERVAGLDLRGVYKKEIYIQPQFIKEIASAHAHKRLAEGIASVEYDTKNGFALRVTLPQGYKGFVELEDVHGVFALSDGKTEKNLCADGKISVQLVHGVWELKKIEANA